MYLYYKCFDKEQVVCFCVLREPPFLVEGGSGKADELTFEQPEETPKREVKPDGAAVIRNRADAAILRQRKWYRG